MTLSVALLAKTVIVLFLQGPRLNVPTRSAKKKGKFSSLAFQTDTNALNKIWFKFPRSFPNDPYDKSDFWKVYGYFVFISTEAVLAVLL